MFWENIPDRLQAQHQTALAGSQSSSRRRNYCLGDPEIQGQLCFNKPGNVPPLKQLRLDHKKEPCATEELAKRKLNITPGGNGSALVGGGGATKWTGAVDGVGMRHVQGEMKVVRGAESAVFGVHDHR